MSKKQIPADRFVSTTRSEPANAETRRVSTNAPGHDLKCWPEFFEAIREGRKTHDLRRSDDRNFRVHDLIRLHEYNPRTERYSGRELVVEITYITSASLPCALSEVALSPSYCILSIRKVT